MCGSNFFQTDPLPIIKTHGREGQGTPVGKYNFLFDFNIPVIRAVSKKTLRFALVSTAP